MNESRAREREQLAEARVEVDEWRRWAAGLLAYRGFEPKTRGAPWLRSVLGDMVRREAKETP